MPHKRNPILTENITGLARIIRMSVVPALENVALWHDESKYLELSARLSRMVHR